MLNSFCRRSFHQMTLLAIAIGTLAMVRPSRAADDVVKPAKPSSHRVLPEGKLPDDARLGPLKNFNSYFPFTPPASLEEWQRRAERVRRQLLVATGLWPMPTKTPLNAVVHGRVERPGYSVDKVYFESFPGHFVSGNLYRPTGRSGKLPGVLCPYGHWTGGRFSEASVREIRKQVVEGAERFEDGGRYPLQARCAELAGMGCIVFHYDMEGYSDSGQISIDVAHHLTKRRPEMDTPEHWGLFSVQAELHLQSVMGIQTWNSVRSLDFLLSQPDVDPGRIAVTGASGGGTQTFLLAAVDPRVKVAVPAVMVSTAMQGGCTCENCCYLRVGTGNIELAGLIAPRPLCCLAADDWTHEIMTKGYPELKKLYGLYGKDKDKDFTAKALLQFPHNYNYVSREVMYQWLNKYFKLGMEEPVIEEDFKPLTVAEMSVWDKEHPRPPGGPAHERALLQWMTDDSVKQMAALVPHGTDEAAKKQAAEWRRVVGGAFDAMIGRELPLAGAVKFDTVRTVQHDGYKEIAGLIRNASEHEELPALLLAPGAPVGNRVAIWVDGAGKAGLFAPDGKLKPGVKQLVDGGAFVLGVDLIYQGEFLPAGATRLGKARRVDDPKNSRDAACFTYGYNPTVFADRVRDVLSAISAVGGALPGGPAIERGNAPRRIDLVGVNGGAPWIAAAKVQAGKSVDRVAIDTAGFRFAKIKSIDDPEFWPGAAKYGDLPALMAFDADAPLFINEGGADIPEIVKVMATFGAGDEVEICIRLGGRRVQDQDIGEFLLK
ncbi:MAG TPA: acetylxylan esterase [Pirellulales bacterium]|nr:acetylxylan esterase [Pirellulales bacterium]